MNTLELTKAHALQPGHWVGGQRGLDRFRQSGLVPFVLGYGINGSSICSGAKGDVWVTAEGLEEWTRVSRTGPGYSFPRLRARTSKIPLLADSQARHPVRTIADQLPINRVDSGICLPVIVQMSVSRVAMRIAISIRF